MGLRFAEDLCGKRFAFAGQFANWPTVLGGRSPAVHVAARGALVEAAVQPGLDFLVLGDKRLKGRAEAIRAADKLQRSGDSIATLDEQAFLHLVRPSLAGQSFVCVGGFSRGGLNLDGGPAGLLADHGATVAEKIASGVDFVVVGDKRGKGKTAALRKVEAMQSAGDPIALLSESELIEIIGCLHDGGAESGDFRTFAARLRRAFNERKVDRALDMLRKQALELYTDVRSDGIGGIVKSQSMSGVHYICWLDDAGQFACSEEGRHSCMGLQNAMCKHILTLVIGLTRAGELELAQAEQLVSAAAKKRPVDFGRRGAELTLRYHGAEAGELDWRPMETVPEDYYAL